MNATSTIETTGSKPLTFLPGDGIFMADGGLETTLVFHQGIDLPEFAAFPLLDSDEGRSALAEYYGPYLRLADETGTGMVVDTPTWRANLDWGVRLGYTSDALVSVNVNAVDFVRREAKKAGVFGVINGVIGPRGDGYVVGEAMTVEEAVRYHSLQVRAFESAGVDVITAVTMTHCAEAIGIVRAATEAGVPVVVSFTVETDGRLPSGMALGQAISVVDRATGGAAASFMINCAHPSHFESALVAGEAWIDRIGAVRANASKMSHEELDNAPELDRGDIAELALDYRRLRRLLPNLRMVGGCCGTDHEHVAAIVGGLDS